MSAGDEGPATATNPGDAPSREHVQQLSATSILIVLAQIVGLGVGLAVGAKHWGILGGLLLAIGGVVVATVGSALFIIVVGCVCFLFGEDALFLPEPKPGEPPQELSASFRRNRAILRVLFVLGVAGALAFWAVSRWRA